ncbi:MAG: hypothetical protein PHH54_06200 [Candidatus Nanoarchaeia archaeon]|nr:hypothetical protein [Candidatus Nanoarchaeia archaeon]MDD5741546.1 hypothetical protein [Candidatus Nanoarchaeia archaeon]
MKDDFRAVGLEVFYPTPCKRIENPEPAVYDRGDIVKILVGPAIGRLGRVVVERNGNYYDYEPDSNPEGVAVSVIEKTELEADLEKMITALGDHEVFFSPVVRWFDGEVINDQLELVRKVRN